MAITARYVQLETPLQHHYSHNSSPPAVKFESPLHHEFLAPLESDPE